MRTGALLLKILALFLLVTFSCLPVAAFCQEGETPTVTAPSDDLRRSQYQLRLGTEDQLQFYVHIWGQVQRPGLYLVTDGTDLVGLISLAGGPTEGAKLAKVTLVRAATISPGTIPVDMQRFTRTGDYSRVPVLEPGDTVIVPSTFWHQFIRFGTVLSVAALFANVIVYATR